MPEKSSFFNAEVVNEKYDRTYNSEDLNEYLSNLISNGIVAKNSTNLQVFAKDNMSVVLKPGVAYINGRRYENDVDYIFNVPPADGVLDRIDRLFIRTDELGRIIHAVYEKGPLASSPAAPALKRNADFYDLAVADISVKHGVLKIIQADITDLRLNNAYCGVVTALIQQVDTTTIFNQYLSWYQQFTSGRLGEFEAWFETIKDILNADTAGNLLNQINALRDTKTAILPVVSWSATVPYTQTVSLAGITVNDTPDFRLAVPGTLTAANIKTQKKNFGYIDFFETGAGTIKFQCYSKKPTVELKIEVKGV